MSHDVDNKKGLATTIFSIDIFNILTLGIAPRTDCAKMNSSVKYLYVLEIARQNLAIILEKLKWPYAY